MKIAKKVKKLRESLKLSQAEFGKIFGMTNCAVSHWESGNRKPRFPQIRQMVQVAKKHNIKLKFEDFAE